MKLPWYFYVVFVMWCTMGLWAATDTSDWQSAGLCVAGLIFAIFCVYQEAEDLYWWTEYVSRHESDEG